MPRLPMRLFVPGLLVLAACSRESSVPTQQDQLAELNVDMVIYDLQHVITTGGVRKANVQGDTAYLRDAVSEMDLRGVRLEFFNEATGTSSGTLTSKTGKYDMRTGAMTATGDAVLTLQGAEGTRVITSEELNFDAQGNRVWSDKPTVMKEGGREVRGTSFESDAKFQNVTVRNPRGSGPAPGGGEGIRF